jgi:hypothetical protein
MEHLVDDFISFVSEFTNLTDADRDQVRTFDRVNALEYDHDVSHWFTPEQVRRLYRNNPHWASLEERIYGDLAFLD